MAAPVSVVLEAADDGRQILDHGEAATADVPASDIAEKTSTRLSHDFDLAMRCSLDPRMPRRPSLDVRVAMGGLCVDHDTHPVTQVDRARLFRKSGDSW